MWDCEWAGKGYCIWGWASKTLLSYKLQLQPHLSPYEGDRSSFSIVFCLCSFFLLMWGPQLLETLTLSMFFWILSGFTFTAEIDGPQFEPSISFIVGRMHYNLHRKEEWEQRVRLDWAYCCWNWKLKVL